MEESDIKLVTTSGFTSRSFNEGRPRYWRSGRQPAGKDAKNGKKGGSSAYLLIRLGVCAACFCAVLGLKLHGDGRALEVIGSSIGENDSGSDPFDPGELGRLRLVELPSIIDVFAPSEKAALPVNAISYEKEEEGGLRILAAPDSEIVSPVKGVVTAVGEHAELGGFVTIEGAGLSFTVYGMGGILVERGQPVSIRQKIGAAKDGAVTVRAEKEGEPVDLFELFSMGDALG